MQSYIILLSLAFLSIIPHSLSNSITVTGTTNVGSEYTRFTYSASPNFSDPSSISLSGARLTKGANNETYEETGFSFYTPPFNGNLGYYFGYFDEQGQFNPNTATLSFSASAIELIANFLNIFVYYDRNGKDGFQYVMGDNIDCIFAPSTSDCVDWGNSIPLSKLSWAPIQITSMACPAGYVSDCKVYAFSASTTGVDAGVATFTYKLASQPVFIDSVLVTPDYAKIDVSIAFPWARIPVGQLQPNPKIGLIGATAGKTATAEATVTFESGKPSVVFTSQGRVGSFSWQSSSVVTAKKKRQAAEAVIYQALQGSDIVNYQCAGLCPDILLLLKPIIAAWQNIFQWKVTILFFSWNTVHPTAIEWDPTLGLSGSGAETILPGALWFVAAVMAVHLLWKM